MCISVCGMILWDALGEDKKQSKISNRSKTGTKTVFSQSAEMSRRNVMHAQGETVFGIVSSYFHICLIHRVQLILRY